ncbi:hypothetical protein C8F01DRAFT_112183 [Mycena amicta]|nr:hypothetical protein C8F01DRAFT_112183 [Mycena amicta]
MGGDHKCPVCQATFTRPQHVARHMRSHTGDRPYKCVHCGDQFARSDLLSRHVNKCHAGAAKSGSSSTAGRRKGSTAAARATTSKQACDQCVQSSLPCDGSNPCAKCVARKTRCTFVKFHRQTAPVGPGHASSLSASTLPSSTTSSLGYPLDLHSGLSGPSGSGGQFLYAQQAAAGGGFVFPPGASHSPTTSVAPPYPAPPGSREGGIPQFAHSHPAHYGDYRDREYEGYDYDRYDGLDASSEHSGSVGAGSRPASSAGLSDYGGYHHHNGRQPSLHAGLDLQQHGRPPHHPHDAPGGRPPEFSNAFGLMSLDDPNVLAGLASDGVPFFANMPPDDLKPHHTHGHRLPHPIPLPLLPPPLAYQPPYGPPPPGSSGSASSASGSVPGNAQTPGTREAETRELREFWKAYMRTPLTGPSSQGGGDPMAHASALGLGMQTPSASASNAAAAAAVAGGGLLAGGGQRQREWDETLSGQQSPERADARRRDGRSPDIPYASPTTRTPTTAADNSIPDDAQRGRPAELRGCRACAQGARVGSAQAREAPCYECVWGRKNGGRESFAQSAPTSAAASAELRL